MSREELQQAVFDLSLFLHTELTGLKREESDDEASLSDLLARTPLEAMDYVNDVVKDLVAYRRNFRNSVVFEQFGDVSKFERALQKLENEVRNHVKVQQQLRLHIESLQFKHDEEVKVKDEAISRYCRTIEALKTEKSTRERRQAFVDMSESPSQETTERKDERAAAIQEIVQLRTFDRQESDRVIELNRRVIQLERQIHKYKAAYLARDQDCRDLQARLDALPRLPHSPNAPRSRKALKEAERSTSREAEGRSYTPVPSTMTASRIPSQKLLHSHSSERKKIKIRMQVRKTENEGKVNSRR